MSGIETLLQNIEGLTPLTVALVLLAGLIVGIAPSSFPLIAVATGLGAGEGTNATDNARMRGFCLSAGFALGIVTVDAILGGLFGLAGFAVLRLLTSALAYVYGLLALILAVTALALWRVIHIAIPMLRPSEGSASTFFGAYALGLPFGLSTCPACTPLLFPVVVAASSTADPILGAVLMGSFGLARGTPLVIAGTTAASLVQFRHTRRVMLWAERAGGVLLMAAAVYFAWQTALYAGWLA